MDPLLTRLQFEAVRLRERVGIVGLVGLLLIALALGIGAIELPLQARSVERARAAYAALAAEALRHPQPRRAAEPRAEQLRHFYALLPAPRQTALIVAGVMRSAQNHGITLPEGEFKLLTTPGEPVARYQMTFPVKAEYGQIRAFVSEVLRTQKAVALESINFQRDDASSPVVKSRIEYTVYLSLMDEAAP